MVVVGKMRQFRDRFDLAVQDSAAPCLEGIPMLLSYSEPKFSAEDRSIFDVLVPFDDWMRRADKFIDFMALRAEIEPLFRISYRKSLAIPN